MPIPVRRTFPTDRDDLIVQVTDDGSRTLVRSGTDDAYHSGCGAVAETRHVYLSGSGVTERLKAGRETRVLEIGLGTSMAMLMTLDQALEHGAGLDYVAIETEWIGAETVEHLEPQTWVKQAEIVERFLQFRRSLPVTVDGGSYRWEVDSRRSVTVEICDVRRWSAASASPFDAIYYDPFCPDSAPELWTPSCMRKMRDLIAEGGRLTTYSCSRPVRTALEQAGWSVQRVPGPEGGKREVIVATPVTTGPANP